jgi:hypothetical protein
MTSNASAELLIRIAADPSSAEQSISQFRTSVSGNLSGTSADFARWSAGGTAEFARMQSAAQTFGGRLRTNFASVNQLLAGSRQSSSLWRAAMIADMQAVENTSQVLQDSLVRGFLLFDEALGRNISNAIIWQKSIGDAFLKAAVTAVGAIAQEALVRAIYSTALGFYLLAIKDFAGAAQAFESAAVFGAVGGAAALAGRALAGAEGGGTGSQAASGSSAGQAPSSQTSKQAGSAQAQGASGQKTVQIVFQGPVYGGQAGIDELVRHISRAVTERDVNLVAYTVVRQPATRA